MPPNIIQQLRFHSLASECVRVAVELNRHGKRQDGKRVAAAAFVFERMYREAGGTQPIMGTLEL